MMRFIRALACIALLAALIALPYTLSGGSPETTQLAVANAASVGGAGPSERLLAATPAQTPTTEPAAPPKPAPAEPKPAANEPVPAAKPAAPEPQAPAPKPAANEPRNAAPKAAPAEPAAPPAEPPAPPKPAANEPAQPPKPAAPPAQPAPQQAVPAPANPSAPGQAAPVVPPAAPPTTPPAGSAPAAAPTPTMPTPPAVGAPAPVATPTPPPAAAAPPATSTPPSAASQGPAWWQNWRRHHRDHDRDRDHDNDNNDNDSSVTYVEVPVLAAPIVEAPAAQAPALAAPIENPSTVAQCFAPGQEGSVDLTLNAGTAAITDSPNGGFPQQTEVLLQPVDETQAPPTAGPWVGDLMFNVVAENGCGGPVLTQLPTPANLGIAINGGVDQGDLHIAYLQGDQWVDVPTVPDPSNPYVSATILSTGTYVVYQAS